MEKRIEQLELEIADIKQQMLLRNAVNEAKLEIYKNIIKLNTNIKLDNVYEESTPKGESTEPWAPIKLTCETPEPVALHPAPAPATAPATAPVPPPIPKETDEEPELNERELEILNKIRSNKNYSRNLIELQKLRSSSFKNGDIDAYKVLCNDHKDKLLEIFAEKGFSDKKIESQLRKALTSFEVRLIRYVNYFNTHLEVDEVKQIGDNLALRWITIKKTPVFSSDSILEFIHNYGLALFPLKTTLQRVLFHPEHGPSIIYRKPEKAAGDSYSFYTLDSVNEDTYKWVMDCRLEEFTTLLKSNLYPYCVGMFKQIYKDVFGDNVYRRDYKSRCQLTEFDCEQLIANILILSSNESLNCILQQIVKDTATVEDKPNYTYNIRGDDNLQKRRWKEFKAGGENFPKDLFDTISQDDIEELRTSRSSK